MALELFLGCVKPLHIHFGLPKRCRFGLQVKVFKKSSTEAVVALLQRPSSPSEDENPHHNPEFIPKHLLNMEPSSPGHGTKMRVAYQGLPGAYSETVARTVYPECETVSCDQFETAFKAVEVWLADKAVLPIENSVGGSIHGNYDLLLQHSLHIIGEVQLVINHCLLGLPGVPKEELKRVISHPQALAQCEVTLSNLGIIRVNADDSAGAAQLVASMGERDTGAVASAQAAEIYGLDILAERIQDHDNNVTRYLILAREPIIVATDRPHKTSIVFTLEGGPRMLFNALAMLALRGIALTKIESRPNRQRPLRVVDDSNNGRVMYFDYIFYAEFEASIVEPRTLFALEHLQVVTLCTVLYRWTPSEHIDIHVVVFEDKQFDLQSSACVFRTISNQQEFQGMYPEWCKTSMIVAGQTSLLL